jgi:nucleoside-diphosphate-sugar epimerase
MKILVTGGTGFVGQYLCRTAINRYYSVCAIVRPSSDKSKLPLETEFVPVDSIASPIPETAFIGVDALIHLAARVHVMKDDSSDPSAAHRQLNTDVTLSLARQAAAQGVKRFIYLSSIKVNGEGGINLDRPYTETDRPQPIEPYGQSKWAAEQGLNQISEQTGLEIVIIRPPLVYGPQVKGNFQQLLRIIQIGLPLPLGSVKNRRSLVYVGNLVDAIITCLNHPNAKNQTFLVSDGEDLSTPDLIRYLAYSLDTRLILLPIPPSLLQLLCQLTGKSAPVSRLLGSLTVSTEKITTILNWQPPYTVGQGIKLTAKWYKSAASVEVFDS